MEKQLDYLNIFIAKDVLVRSPDPAKRSVAKSILKHENLTKQEELMWKLILSRIKMRGSGEDVNSSKG